MSQNRSKSPLALLGTFALALGACDGAPARNDPRPMADAARGSEMISNRHFGRVTVPCEDPEQTARALLQLTARDLGDDARTRLLDYGTDEVRLKDGTGKIAVIVYAVSADDDQAAVTTTEHFLISESCQVMPWSSAVAATR